MLADAGDLLWEDDFLSCTQFEYVAGVSRQF
jgi:hypothetical protein